MPQMKRVKIPPGCKAVYGLRENDKYRYVGLSSCPEGRARMLFEGRESQSKKKQKWAESLRRRDTPPKVDVLAIVAKEHGRFFEEKFVVGLKARGHRLVNRYLTPAGPNGKKMSMAHRRKISLAHTGLKRSPEICARYSEDSKRREKAKKKRRLVVQCQGIRAHIYTTTILQVIYCPVCSVQLVNKVHP